MHWNREFSSSITCLIANKREVVRLQIKLNLEKEYMERVIKVTDK